MRRRRATFTAIAIIASILVSGLQEIAVASAAGRTGYGYWEAQSDGGVFAMGDAADLGHATRLAAPIVGIAARPGGQGYLLAGADGGVFTFGRAEFFGSMGGTHLNRPVVGIAYTPSGRGYYLVAADGGVFTFGDATFHGSTGAMHLNQPIVGMDVTATGNGYWLVAADGGVFTFGDAPFRGSAAQLMLSAPIVGMAASSAGGYWLAGRDGAIYSFGTRYLGSPKEQINTPGGQHTRLPIAAIAASPTGGGYLIMSTYGDVTAFGDASACARAVNNRDRETGSEKLNNVGITIPFDAATLESSSAGSCGSLSRPFRLQPPFRIDVIEAAAPPDQGPGAICGLFFTPGNLNLLTYMQLQTPGRMQVRATQMAGSTSFRIAATPNCLALARPGAGGTQSLPFTTSRGGDTLPFSSASPITIDSIGQRFKNTTTRQICRVQVYRNSDGHLVYERQSSLSHTVLPAGTYFLRSEEYGCPATVK